MSGSKKLLAGELEEINHTVAEVLTGLQLPFQTNCDCFLQNGRSVCLYVELPEIKEVIPDSLTARPRCRPHHRGQGRRDYNLLFAHYHRLMTKEEGARILWSMASGYFTFVS